MASLGSATLHPDGKTPITKLIGTLAPSVVPVDTSALDQLAELVVVGFLSIRNFP